MRNLTLGVSNCINTASERLKWSKSYAVFVELLVPRGRFQTPYPEVWRTLEGLDCALHSRHSSLRAL